MLKIFSFKDIKVDLIWNYISLLILAISGLALNVIISQYYEPKILGAFNQVVSIYLVAAMIGSGGINYSVLQSIPTNRDIKSKLNDIIFGGIILSLTLSFIVSFIFILLIIPVSNWLESDLVKTGLFFITPGLFFFSLNKILLQGIINGLQRMKEFAFFQSTRYFLILINLLIAIQISIDGEKLPFIFSCSEFLLFILLITRISMITNWWNANNWMIWLRKHFIFSLKSFSSGVIIELNSRVDIICIGYFLNDEKVGIYSFSALFAEGFLQALIVLQNIFNPKIAKLFSSNNTVGFLNMIQKTKKPIYYSMVILFIFSTIFYSSIINLLTNNFTYQDSKIPFFVLIFGITLASGYIPYFNLFFMKNLPTWQTFFVFLIITTNIFFNFLLIPIFGINGAAIATAISFISSIIFLKKLVKKLIGLRI